MSLWGVTFIIPFEFFLKVEQNSTPMKQIIAIILITSISMCGEAQKISVQTGLGSVMAKRALGTNVRGLLYIGAYGNVNKSLAIGFELSNSGRLLGYPNKSGFTTS
jgi:hypothetical protein